MLAAVRTIEPRIDNSSSKTPSLPWSDSSTSPPRMRTSKPAVPLSHSRSCPNCPARCWIPSQVLPRAPPRRPILITILSFILELSTGKMKMKRWCLWKLSTLMCR
uniref:Uncharacterized protein n=1 Tax=Cacopsylla melanoneura TaxID=428564 RepID=A0A8D8QJL9_9HEMI